LIGKELNYFSSSVASCTARTMKRSKIFGLVFFSSCIFFSCGKSFGLLIFMSKRMTQQDKNLPLNFRCTVLNLCVKQHRVTVLVQARVLTLSRAHFAVPM